MIYQGISRNGSANYIWIALMMLIGLFAVSTLQGQSYRSTINGNVTDQTGAVVVGAQVQVIDETTKFVSNAVTNSAGLYSVPFLMPDTYDVQVDAKGFSSAKQTQVVLIASDVKQVDFKLSPASTTATVSVIANEELLQTETASISTVLTSNIVQNSPNIDGNPYMLATRVAGVYSNFTQSSESLQWYPVGGGVSGTAFGGLAGNSLITVNGISITPPEGNPGSYTGYVPPALAVQELKVSTATYDAEVGHTDGGSENTVLRTGTAKLHGEASFMYGDTIFNSNTYERSAYGGAKPRLDNIFSEPAFVITGPVSIPKLYHGNGKTFFMATYEHIQYANGSNFNFVPSVPTLKERTGDFSELTAATGGSYLGPVFTGVIYDPTTTATTPTSQPWCSPNCTSGSRQSFTQEYNEGASSPSSNCPVGVTNCIPTSRLNTVGKNLMAYYPTPTTISPTTPGVNNWLPTNGLSNPAWMWTAAFSIDHEFNDRNKLTVAFMPYFWKAGSSNQGYPFVNGYSGGPGYPVAPRTRYGGIIDYTKTITPSMVLDVRTGGFYNFLTIARPGDNLNLAGFGFTGNTLSFQHPNFPAVNISGPFGGETLLNSGASVYEYSALEDNTAVLSKTFQRHAVKTGFEFMLTRTDPSQAGTFAFAGNGTPFTFNTVFTNNSGANNNSGSLSPAIGTSLFTPTSAVTNGGDGVAAALLGYPTSGQANIVPAPAYEWNYWAGFVQDDWRITKNLVLNLGVRWDYNSPFTERHNRLNLGFDFSSTNPMNQGVACSAAQCTPPTTGAPQGYHGGLEFVSASNRLYFQRELNRFQPRIGAAWHVFPNTVLRGGYGVYFAPNYPAAVSNTGFSAPTNLVASNGGNFYTPNTCTTAQGGDAYGFCNMSNPYPGGYNQPTGSSLGLATATGTSLSFAGPNWASIRNSIWSVGIEQQLPWQTMVDVTYQGNLNNGLAVGKNWNALPNCYYYGGSCPNAGNATALGALVTNPMAGYLPSTSALNAAKVAQQQLYLPYPQFSTINQSVSIIDGTRQRLGTRRDDSLFVTLTKRASHGLEFNIAATYAKVENQFVLLNPGDPVNQPFKEDDTQPNRFLVANVVYDTPKFPVNHVLGAFLNDWKWTHSLNWQAGVSLNVPLGAFATGVSPVTHHQSLAHWYNSCYIPVVANGNVGQTLPGNSSPNTSPVYGSPTNCQFGEQPAWIQQPTQTLNQLNNNPMRNVRLQTLPVYGMALLKSVPIREGIAFTFSVNAFNVFNMDLLGTGPTTTLTSPSAGANSFATVPGSTKPIYTQANDPRIMRFEGRLTF